MAEEHIQQSTAMTPSIYDTHAPKLQSLGYFTTCIGPGTKAPQHVDRQTGAAREHSQVGEPFDAEHNTSAGMRSRLAVRRWDCRHRCGSR